MQAALERPPNQGGIESKAVPPYGDVKIEIAESPEPTLSGPIGMGKGYTMMGIRNPVHKPQCCTGKKAIARVILDQEAAAGNSRGLSEHGCRIVHVM